MQLKFGGELRPEDSFEVLDALGGWFRLERGDATLSGSIPLRAARACTPLLEGNAFGYRLVTDSVLTVHRKFGLWRLDAPLPAEVRRAQRAVLPYLTLQGVGRTPPVSPDGSVANFGLPRLMQRLERAWVWIDGAASRSPQVTLFTGLFVRATPSCELLLGCAGNRRSMAYGVEPCWLRGPGYVPVVLVLTYRGFAEPSWEVTGEVASLLPMLGPQPFTYQALRARPELGCSHASFYDAQYFAQKKQGPTHKYKELLRKPAQRCAPAAEWVPLAPAAEEAREQRDVSVSASTSPAVLIRNAVSFEATFDGQRVVVTCEPRELEEYTRSVEAEWKGTYGTIGEARGALLYFTKYATLHQVGEPYFFVKPAALVRTPPGTACLVEGLCGPEYDVLRGLVRTDVFHALPAVIRLNWPGKRVRVPKGTPLAWAIAFERSNPHPTYKSGPVDLRADLSFG